MSENIIALSIHYGVGCDACKVSPIIGYRYKCSSCPSFNLCANCELQAELKPNIFHPDTHFFVKISREITSSNTSVYLCDKSSWLHSGTSCSTCKINPIIGFRYVSTATGDSYCESCEQNTLFTTLTAVNKIKMLPGNFSSRVRQFSLA